MAKYSQVIWDSEERRWVKVGGSEMVEIHYGTKAEWQRKAGRVSKLKDIYVYTDYETTEDEFGNQIYIPGIKIGDGNAYIADLPFISGDYEGIEQDLQEHISNISVHVTPQEKDFWNSKYRAVVDGEELIFITD